MYRSKKDRYEKGSHRRFILVSVETNLTKKNKELHRFKSKKKTSNEKAKIVPKKKPGGHVGEKKHDNKPVLRYKRLQGCAAIKKPTY